MCLQDIETWCKTWHATAYFYVCLLISSIRMCCNEVRYCPQCLADSGSLKLCLENLLLLQIFSRFQKCKRPDAFGYGHTLLLMVKSFSVHLCLQVYTAFHQSEEFPICKLHVFNLNGSCMLTEHSALCSLHWPGPWLLLISF